MNIKSRDKLLCEITHLVFQLDEPIEEKLKILKDMIFFIEGYQVRSEGYQLRKELKK